MSRKSNLFGTIKKFNFTEPFTVNDINKFCNNLLENSPSFLSKHCDGNPLNYTVFLKESVEVNTLLLLK